MYEILSGDLPYQVFGDETLDEGDDDSIGRAMMDRLMILNDNSEFPPQIIDPRSLQSDNFDYTIPHLNISDFISESAKDLILSHET